MSGLPPTPSLPPGWRSPQVPWSARGLRPSRTYRPGRSWLASPPSRCGCAAAPLPTPREGGQAMSISVLIMTLNEEVNLPACLAAVAWSNDIVVLDSFSTDGTIEIARAAGARVYQHEYVDELSQRRYGLKEIAFKHPWVYIPDADEVTPPELRDEMLAIAADPYRPESVFRCRFRVFFMGRCFLDGWPGYVYCQLLASYEFMIVVKMAEIRRRQRGLPI